MSNRRFWILNFSFSSIKQSRILNFSFSSIIIVLFLILCFQPAFAEYWEIIPGSGLGPFFLAVTSKGEIMKTLGEPSDEDAQRIIYRERGLEFQFDPASNILISISIKSSGSDKINYVTEKQIRVGSWESQIMKEYGMPAKIESGDYMDYIYQAGGRATKFRCKRGSLREIIIYMSKD